MAKKLATNPNNPRTIRDPKLKRLKDTMERLGDISGIIFNRRTELLIGGNQRTSVIGDAEPVIEVQYDEPTRTGTVAEGYVIHKGERFRYREVEWDEATEREAIITANVSAGDWNIEELEANWDKEELASFGMEEFGAFADEDDDEEPEGPRRPGKSGDDYSTFEVVMNHPNKVILIETLAYIRRKDSLDKMEDALMVLINTYKATQEPRQ